MIGLKWNVYKTSSLPKIQGQSWKGEDKECKGQMCWTKYYFMDTAGQLHIYTHSDWDSLHKTCVTSSQTKSQHREKS